MPSPPLTPDERAQAAAEAVARVTDTLRRMRRARSGSTDSVVSSAERR